MRVLVTGATGYIGSRLVPALLRDGHEVVAAMRDPDRRADYAWGDRVEAVRFDVEDVATFTSAVQGVDAVFWLVHSMARGEFVGRDRRAAEAMAAACAAEGVAQVVYLSGLVPDGRLSAHLSSRLEVERVFLDGQVPAVVLRAAMVIGSGSTSFELLRRLSERLPVTPLPAWMRSRLQPIAVEDVTHLLTASLGAGSLNRAFDVGGEEVVGYPELLSRFAAVAGLRRLQVVVPFVPVSVTGRAVALITGLPTATVGALVDSLAHDMVCEEDDFLTELLDRDHRLLPLDEALRRSLDPVLSGTGADGDPQTGAVTDPEWAGGSVTVSAGRVVQLPRSILAAVLLGVRTVSAERRRPERLL